MDVPWWYYLLGVLVVNGVLYGAALLFFGFVSALPDNELVHQIIGKGLLIGFVVLIASWFF